MTDSLATSDAPTLDLGRRAEYPHHAERLSENSSTVLGWFVILGESFPPLMLWKCGNARASRSAVPNRSS